MIGSVFFVDMDLLKNTLMQGGGSVEQRVTWPERRMAFGPLYDTP